MHAHIWLMIWTMRKKYSSFVFCFYLLHCCIKISFFFLILFQKTNDLLLLFNIYSRSIAFTFSFSSKTDIGQWSIVVRINISLYVCYCAWNCSRVQAHSCMRSAHTWLKSTRTMTKIFGFVPHCSLFLQLLLSCVSSSKNDYILTCCAWE